MTKKLTPMDKAFAKVLRCLNSAFKADPAAIHCMLCAMIPCKGNGLLKHPSVIVGRIKTSGGQHTLSPLGLINGLLNSAGMPRVAMKWEPTGRKAEHEGPFKLVGFVRAGDVCQPKKFRKVKK